MVFENLSFKRGGSTVAGLMIYSGLDGPYSFGTTVNRCAFWKIGATATSGALCIDSSWHTNVLNSWFEECPTGIKIAATKSNPVGIVIKNCDFVGLAATNDCNIYSSIALSVAIEHCRFHGDQPSAGSVNKYFYFPAGSDGLVSQCYFGTETATLTSAATYPAGVNVVHCFYEAATNLTA
jgi:hypothetical protein